jgi:hypothetical protein
MAHRQPGGRAANMMAQAVDLAANADAGTQAWLHSWHAIRLARADDEHGFFTHMQRADQLRSGTADTPGFFISYARITCTNYHLDLGAGLAALRRSDEALEAFARQPHPVHLRNRAYMLARRAEAQLVKREPDPEAACADLMASFELGRDAGVVTAMNRVREVRDGFPKRYAGLACLAELDERLALSQARV